MLLIVLAEFTTISFYNYLAVIVFGSGATGGLTEQLPLLEPGGECLECSLDLLDSALETSLEED